MNFLYVAFLTFVAFMLLALIIGCLGLLFDMIAKLIESWSNHEKL